MKENKYWLGDKRFYIILAALFILWGGVMLLFYLKAEEVTKNPCQVCAKKMGTSVVCTTQGTKLVSRIFYPNYSVQDVGN